MITVLIPAHNEQDQIGPTIQSLRAQSAAPGRVIVVADNCTDNTQSIALSEGAEVFETRNNTFKKAGALNQALDHVLPGLDRGDHVLIMDADTRLVPAFLSVALDTLSSSAEIGAVGGVFYGDAGGGLMGLLQRNEYARYSREIDRTGRVMVLTGTAALFRPDALEEVAEQRGDRLPGAHGQVYDTHALTEDNELTLCLKTLGWKLESPIECATVTEIMPNPKTLWNQRLRWFRGAVENLRTFGFTKVTARYWGQQAMISVGIFALYLYVTLTVLHLALGGTLTLNPFWVAITALFVAERVITVWKQGWTARLLASVLVVEMAYDMFLQVVFVKAVYNAVRKREAVWTHVSSATPTY